jgi:hypothetical protein
MKKAFLNWLSDFLSDWVQLADERASAAIRETHELLDKAYQSYCPFEHYSDTAEVREFRHHDVMLQRETWGWQIQLDDERFYTLRDPKGEIYRIKEYAVDQLTRKFRQHIGEKLFALPNP